jgi:hypothetical protein
MKVDLMLFKIIHSRKLLNIAEKNFITNQFNQYKSS